MTVSDLRLRKDYLLNKKLDIEDYLKTCGFNSRYKSLVNALYDVIERIQNIDYALNSAINSLSVEYGDNKTSLASIIRISEITIKKIEFIDTMISWHKEGNGGSIDDFNDLLSERDTLFEEYLAIESKIRHIETSTNFDFNNNGEEL